VRAVILIGHGSLRADSGAAMIRLAARVREAEVAPIAAAAFLNYSRPALGEALERVAAGGATEVIVQPYFLVPGHYVRNDLARLVAAAQAANSTLPLQVAEPLGDHPALAELVIKRAQQATAETGNLLLVAHGSPDPTANRPIEAVLGRVRERSAYAGAELCYLGLNQPLVPAALDRLAEQGAKHVTVVPYFIQLGGHVARDLPQHVERARTRHAAMTITLAAHLGYDPLLVQVIAERVRQLAPQPEGGYRH
jgi:sirohydrochlorin cobaltochelatase